MFSDYLKPQHHWMKLLCEIYGFVSLCVLVHVLCDTITPCQPSINPMCMRHTITPYLAPAAVLIGLTGDSLPSSQPLVPPSWCRCIEEDAGLLDLEPLPGYPKGLELHKPADEPFDVKDIFNTSLESEALKETLLRQAKTQVCLYTHLRHKV